MTNSFEYNFSKPVQFNDGSFLLNARYTKEQAAKLFSEHLGGIDINIDSIEWGFVKAGVPQIKPADKTSRKSWFMDDCSMPQRVWIYCINF